MLTSCSRADWNATDNRSGYYIVFVVLVFISFCLTTRKLRKPWPSSLQWIQTYFIRSTLFSLRHNVPTPIFGLRSFTIQAPLRYQAAIVVGIIVFNVLPLVQSYRIVPGDRDVL